MRQSLSLKISAKKSATTIHRSVIVDSLIYTSLNIISDIQPPFSTPLRTLRVFLSIFSGLPITLPSVHLPLTRNFQHFLCCLPTVVQDGEI